MVKDEREKQIQNKNKFFEEFPNRSMEEIQNLSKQIHFDNLLF